MRTQLRLKALEATRAFLHSEAVPLLFLFIKEVSEGVVGRRASLHVSAFSSCFQAVFVVLEGTLMWQSVRHSESVL